MKKKILILGAALTLGLSLIAEFSFADGSTASLVWFWADGGLVHNEEFSRLPEEPAAGNGGR